MQTFGFSAASGTGPLPLHNVSDDARLAVFDDPLEWQAFSQQANTQADTNAVQSFVVIRGMRCAACALKLETALKQVRGVLAVQIGAASQSASVIWSTELTRPSAWMSASLAKGYELLPAQDTAGFVNERQQSRLALWRWLVAGFCMMQVMMYAAPGYFAQPGDMTPDIDKLLRWASWVLSLPVVLFSCQPFLRSAWRDLTQRSISMDLPVAMGIVTTFAVSTAATFEPQGWWGSAVYFDSLTMFVFFLLTGRWLEQRLKSRTAGALGALMQRLPDSVDRQMPGGAFEMVAVRRLVRGDVVRVRPGEAFPADGCVLEGRALADEALLTGESRPVVREVGAPVLAGSFNVGSAALVRIEKLGTETRYAEIIALMARASVDKPRLAVMADRVAKPFLVFVLLAAVGAAAFWWRTDPAFSLMAAVAVLVVTCPCALSLATPTAMLTTAGWLARQGVLVRRMQALETLSQIDTVIFDKTGTLTDPAARLLSVQTRDGITKTQALQWAGGLAVHSLHPVSIALVRFAGNVGKSEWKGVKELTGQGLQGWLVDACQQVSGGLRLGSQRFCQVSTYDNQADDAVRRVFLADERGWMATFEFAECLRQDAVETVAGMMSSGLDVHLLSGDSMVVVQKVALQLGITQVQGECTPESKLAFLKALQAKGHKVLMVGDGLNDGPTLAAAHASVAIGAAVPLAQAQSDFVIPGGQLHLLPVMVRHAKRTLRVVKQNLAWAAAYNAICVPLAMAAMLPAWLAGLGMAMSSLLVMANAARLSRADVTL